MRIEFQRSGGAFAPAQRRAYAIDTADLSQDEARELTTVVNSSGILDAPEDSPSPPASPDRFYYKIQVEEGGRNHTLRVSEVNMPEQLRPLINWLKQRATPGG